jgi:hypothetical protein
MLSQPLIWKWRIRKCLTGSTVRDGQAASFKNISPKYSLEHRSSILHLFRLRQRHLYSD